MGIVYAFRSFEKGNQAPMRMIVFSQKGTYKVFERSQS